MYDDSGPLRTDGGSVNSKLHVKKPTTMFKSMYSKKVPKDIFEMDDNLSTKFLHNTN